MTTRSHSLELRGLIVLFGPASAGKTTSLLKLREHGIETFLYDEPREPMNLDWPLLPTEPTVRTTVDEDGEPIESEEADPDGAVLIDDLPAFCAVDSLRTLMFSAPGAALKGGISAGALLPLTRLHNALWESEKAMLATINPVYEDQEASASNLALALGLISGSVGGVLRRSGRQALQPVSHHFDWEPKPVSDSPSNLTPWVIQRDRASQLDQLLTILNAN